jgi:plasmid stability protein
MQYTLRNIPPQLDEALRTRAREQGKSLNEIALETLLAGVGLSGAPIKRRDLSDIAGTWVEDPEIDAALQDQRRIQYLPQLNIV